MLLKIIFWVSLFLVAYCYLLYGGLIWILLKIRKIFFRERFHFDKTYMPDVTLLVAVYNEEDYIRDKIANTLQLDYPADKLKIIFITDGSTDGSNAIIKEYNRISLMHEPERKGKVAAINRAMKSVDTPIVVFCDANTQLNRDCILEIVKHYADPRTGGVAGEKIVRDASDRKTAAGAGEGLYWKYESFLKKLDSDFYSVVGAAGELFSVRTELYEPTPENVLLDDFVISLRIAQKGFRILYEPKAYAIEAPSFDVKEEQKRKIRIGAGGFQSVLMLLPLLNIFRYPKLSFQYISHRVMRWIICPFLLPVILVLNLWIVFNNGGLGYIIIMGLQLIFYAMAAIGYFQAVKNKKSKLFYIPYYFVFMNISLYLGLIRFLKQDQSVLWEKAKRQNAAPSADDVLNR